MTDDSETGLIYFSYIPEGMTPASLRQIISKYAEIGRIYLEPYNKNDNFDPKSSGDASKLLEDSSDQNSGQNSNFSKSKKKSNSYNSGRFKEGWVEFENKRRAKKIAKQLNLTEIAEKKHGAWSGQFWSMKYLHKFKWSNLHEQLDFERQLRKKKIREEFVTARNEQTEYLKVVAASRKAKNIANRKRKNNDGKSCDDLLADDDDNTEKRASKVRLPKQRKIASDYTKSNEKEGSKILSKFFG